MLGRPGAGGIQERVPIDMDAWLPDPQVRSRHCRTAAVDPGTLWHAAEGVRLRDTPTLGRVVRWRIPGTTADDAFRDLFRAYPFAVLAEDDGWSLSGLCGRIWTVARDYPRIDGPDEFRAWQEPGTVRVLFGNWVEPDRDGRAALVSESRVQAVDRGAELRLRALWAVVGRFERLIGGEALRVAARRAEQRVRDSRR
jgi:transposase